MVKEKTNSMIFIYYNTTLGNDFSKLPYELFINPHYKPSYSKFHLNCMILDQIVSAEKFVALITAAAELRLS